ADGEGGGTLVLEGSYADAESGEADRWFRVTWTIASEAEHEERITLRTPEGREYDVMKMTFSR
ncbi:MAG: hypothetical protein AAF368_11210, partial [Planctomycetota bacterium]